MVPLPSDADALGAARESAKQEAALWHEFKANGSVAARERLFSLHATFARNIARRHHREHSHGEIELADLHQHAYTGLLEALDRFDPQCRTPFRPFAAHRISGSVLDGIGRISEMREQISWHRRARRERVHSLSQENPGQPPDPAPIERLAEIAVALALGFMLEGSGMLARDEGEDEAPASTAYDSVAWRQTVSRLGREVAALPEREQAILRQHYMNEMNFEQLAALLRISKARVSQLHRGALLTLRKRMRAQGHFHVRR